MKIVLPEIVAVGIYNSHIAVKNKTITKNRKTTMFEIEIPIGNGGISYIDDEKTEIKPELVICAKPGQMRHTKLPFKCYYVHLIIKEGLLYQKLMAIPNYMQTEKREQYINLFKKMCKYYDGAVDDDGIMLQSLVLELVHYLLQDSKKMEIRAGMKSSNYKTIESTVAYIQENLTADLSLNRIADYAGFSPIHFHAVFKASTGRTLREYVEEQRIKKAASMLITTDYTLTKIAYECGFSSQSYFSYAFKRRMKKTPKDYAKEVFERYESNM